MCDYPALFEPITLAGKMIRNRIVLSPMGTRANLLDGTLSDRCAIFLEERARGGAGLIITEQTAVREGQMRVPTMQANSDLLIPALSQLAASVHAYDSHILMQLGLHGGRAPSSVTGNRCIAPSAVASPLYKEIPEALTEEEIYALVDDWRFCAMRAKRAGFDGVEVHGCHGYLINQFLSPVTNCRRDAFGGSLINRLYFAKLIVSAVREACGADFIIGFKMPGFENFPGGIEPEDAVIIAKEMERYGVDYLHVSANSLVFSAPQDYPYTPYADVPSMYDEKGCLVPLAEMVKKAVSVPVIAVGGIVTPQDAEQVISNRQADMVAVGRPFLADPEWGEKPLSQEIARPCVGCLECHKHILTGTDLVCTVNPGLLREFYGRPSSEKSKPKSVVIVGAGPGGMEAAIQAADRGYKVTVYDSGEGLGGTLRLAAKPDFKERVRELLAYYKQEIEQRNIHLIWNTKVDEENVSTLLQCEQADSIILATGGIPVVPPFARDAKMEVLIAEDLIEKGVEGFLPEQVAIIGAGKVGLETAWLLSLAGKKVAVYDMLPMEKVLAADHPVMRAALLHRMNELGVRIYTEARLNRIMENTLHFNIAGEEAVHKAECVVLAIGYRPDHTLYRNLLKAGCCKKILLIGDAKAPRGMFDAIHEGYFAGRYRI